MRPGLDTAALSSLSEARANIYGFLSRLLLEPPAEAMLSPLRQPEFHTDLAQICGQEALRYFQDFILHFPDDLVALIQEYHDLFKVPLGRYVTPYEAVYRDKREVEGKQIGGLLMGESTVAVEQSYRLAGVHMSEDLLELPDHAGVELSFMSYLCCKQTEALNQDDEQRSLELQDMQKAFLAEHLRPWIPSLCARIFENAREPFYKGVARIIDTFIAREAELLSQVGAGTQPWPA